MSHAEKPGEFLSRPLYQTLTNTTQMTTEISPCKCKIWPRIRKALFLTGCYGSMAAGILVLLNLVMLLFSSCELRQTADIQIPAPPVTVPSDVPATAESND